MRRLSIAIVFIGTTMAVATPALARDGAWYVGGDFGAMIVDDIDFDIGAVRGAAKAELKTAYDVDAIVGHDFGGFRVEAEVGYKEAKLDGYTSSITTFRDSALGIAPPGSFSGIGNTYALSLMLNGLADFGDDDGLNFSVGGGAGAAQVKVPEFSIDRIVPFLSGSQTVFAFQLIGEARLPVTDHIDLNAKYRYFQTGTVSIDDPLGRPNDFKLRSHSFLFGATYNFGGSAPPPPAPPPPEPNPNPTEPVM